jgi:hypothetical protein
MERRTWGFTYVLLDEGSGVLDQGAVSISGRRRLTLCMAALDLMLSSGVAGFWLGRGRRGA